MAKKADYVIYFTQISVPGQYYTPHSWFVRGVAGRKGCGNPTKENLQAYMEALLASQLPGECNEHLGTKVYPIRAALWTNYVKQKNHMVADWELDRLSEIGQVYVHINAPFTTMPKEQLDRMLVSVKGLLHPDVPHVKENVI